MREGKKEELKILYKTKRERERERWGIRKRQPFFIQYGRRHIDE